MHKTASRRPARRDRLSAQDTEKVVGRVVRGMIRDNVPPAEAMRKLGHKDYREGEEGSEGAVDARVRERIARELEQYKRLHPKSALFVGEYLRKSREGLTRLALEEGQTKEDAEKFADEHVEWEKGGIKAFGKPGRGKLVWYVKAKGSDGKERRLRTDTVLREKREKYGKDYLKFHKKRLREGFQEYAKKVGSGETASKALEEEKRKIAESPVKLDPLLIGYLNRSEFMEGGLEDAIRPGARGITGIMDENSLMGVLLREGASGSDAHEAIRRFVAEALPEEDPSAHALLADRIGDEYHEWLKMLTSAFPQYRAFVIEINESRAGSRRA
ncbi:MAG: hypothetical protein PHF51_03195 [Candidatus ainarchaeum sp.]|nr:hypothetical protein [Candidatus ainarchaeum sp.]